MKIAWRQWRLGALVAIFLGLLSAGAGLLGDMSWKSFVAVACTSLLTHFAAFLSQNPVNQISFDTAQIQKP